MTLSPTEQHRLAVWGAKLSLVYESLAGSRQVIPDDVYHWFFKNRQPFPDNAMRIARYTDDEHHLYARRVLKVRDRLTGRLLGIEGVMMMTIVIGAFIIQCIIPTNGGGIRFDLEEGSDSIGIWPLLLRPAEWPPNVGVDFRGLGTFTDIVMDEGSITNGPAWSSCTPTRRAIIRCKP